MPDFECDISSDWAFVGYDCDGSSNHLSGFFQSRSDLVHRGIFVHIPKPATPAEEVDQVFHQLLFVQINRFQSMFLFITYDCSRAWVNVPQPVAT